MTAANGRTEVQELARVGAALTAQIARATRGARDTVDRRALKKAEAAHALGVSLDFFKEHIYPELRVVIRGRRVLVPIAEIDRWLAENAERTLR